MKKYYSGPLNLRVEIDETQNRYDFYVGEAMNLAVEVYVYDAQTKAALGNLVDAICERDEKGTPTVNVVAEASPKTAGELAAAKIADGAKSEPEGDDDDAPALFYDKIKSAHGKLSQNQLRGIVDDNYVAFARETTYGTSPLEPAINWCLKNPHRLALRPNMKLDPRDHVTDKDRELMAELLRRVPNFDINAKRPRWMVPFSKAVITTSDGYCIWPAAYDMDLAMETVTEAMRNIYAREAQIIADRLRDATISVETAHHYALPMIGHLPQAVAEDLAQAAEMAREREVEGDTDNAVFDWSAHKRGCGEV